MKVTIKGKNCFLLPLNYIGIFFGKKNKVFQKKIYNCKIHMIFYHKPIQVSKTFEIGYLALLRGKD